MNGGITGLRAWQVKDRFLNVGRKVIQTQDLVHSRLSDMGQQGGEEDEMLGIHALVVRVGKTTGLPGYLAAVPTNSSRVSLPSLF